jgi:hypothetical protein
MYSIWNPLATPQKLLATISYGDKGETFKLPIQLDPYASTMVDIGELERSQLADRDGNVLPTTAHIGSFALGDPSEVTEAFITAVTSSGIYNPTKGTCGNGSEVCCGITQLDVVPTFTSGPGGSTQLSFTYVACTGGVLNVTGSSTWESSSTPVVTVQTLGQSSPGMVTAVAPDTANINAFYPVTLPVNAGTISGQLPLPACPSYNGGIGGSVPATVTACATSVTLSNTTQIPLANDFPTYKSGIGIVVAMQVQPAASNWDGSTVVESVTTASNTCPASFGNQCSGNTTFTVGTGGESVGGVDFVPKHNIFYDQHITTSAVSMLDAAGISSCTTKCSQTYSCGGKVIGTFSITRAYSKGTISGTPVTFVTVTKQ